MPCSRSSPHSSFDVLEGRALLILLRVLRLLCRGACDVNILDLKMDVVLEEVGQGCCFAVRRPIRVIFEALTTRILTLRALQRVAAERPLYAKLSKVEQVQPATSLNPLC